MEDSNLQCQGCGVTIQTDRKNELGYAPPSAFNRETLICQRCFRLKHYNEIQAVSITDDDFLNILHGVGNADALVVKIVDIFDFYGSWLQGLPRFVGNKKIFLVGNKVDLLPKSTNKNKVINWMRFISKDLGMKPDDVFLISAEKGMGIKELAREIEAQRDGKDVYVVGCTNVGKSTFINRLIKNFTGDKEDVITTSRFPGTTLDLIGIPLNDGTFIYDTPGIINHHQMAHFVDDQGLKKIQPKKEIKPRVFQLNPQQTLFFGGLARFDFVSGGRHSFVCYLSNEIEIHRTKLENADQLYEKHVGEMLQPSISTVEDVKLVKQEFVIKEEKVDVVISGLGWITINEPGIRVAVHAPKGVGVSLRKSII